MIKDIYIFSFVFEALSRMIKFILADLKSSDYELFTVWRIEIITLLALARHETMSSEGVWE